MKYLICKSCGHEWDYKGKSNFYVTCPHCYNKMNIKNDKPIRNIRTYKTSSTDGFKKIRQL